MRRKLLFLMLFAGLLCMSGTVQAGKNLNINPGFEIDLDPADGTPDGWGIWVSGGFYDNCWYGNQGEADPDGARNGDWYVHLDMTVSNWGGSCGYQAPDAPTPHADGTKWLAPIKQAGTYFIGGYAKDMRPGGEDSPGRPESEVIYHNDDGVRVDEDNSGPGDPYRHWLFRDFSGSGTPGTGDYDFVFPRDGEYHLYYGLTKPIDVLPPEATYVAANAYADWGCIYHFDDMWTGDSLPGSLVWAVDPYDGESGVSPNQTTLQWARQKVCDGARAIKCEIWWGEAADPNFWIEPHKKIMELSDANSLDLSTIPEPLGGPIVLAPEEHFYWKIVYEEPNECFWGTLTEDSAYYFNTINDPPVVDAGLHYDVWQDPCSNPITIGIDASYEDDGNPEGGKVTHEWNIVSGVVYSPHRFCQDPNVTIAAVGDYELTLTIHDGVGDFQDKTGEGSTLIRVFSNTDDRLRVHCQLDGNAIDSAEAHSTSIVDDPTWGTGQVVGAVVLDGSDDLLDDGLGDAVQIDDTGSDPNFQADTWENSDLIDGMTVSAWMKLDEDGWSTTWETIVAKNNSSWELNRNADNDNVRFVVHPVIGDAISSGATDMESGWHQVVGVYDRNTVKVYVDGVESGSVNANPLDLEAESNFDYLGQPINDKDWQIPKAPGKIRIGAASNDTGDLAFAGLIDQVRIFDAAVPWWAQHSGTPGIVEMYRADNGHPSCGGQYVTSDINEDCFTTLADCAELFLVWLECTNVADENCDLTHHEE